MKKTIAKGMALAFVGSLLVAGSAMALPSVGFDGTFTLTDSDDADTFRESLDLGLAYVNVIDLLDGLLANDYYDPAIGDNIYAAIEFDILALDPTDPYNFNPTLYAGGFKFYDVDSTGALTQLFTADLTMNEIEIINTGGIINSAFSMNLTSITETLNYTIGTSLFVDAMLNAPGGATNITLNYAGDLAAIINNTNGNPAGSTVESTYSGNAAPVPEPATMLLMGSGLAGLAGVARRRSKKA